MENGELQQQLFSYLKSVLPAHLSLAEELSELLGLSTDSAYRRIRGEKPITLTELKLICEKFKLSLDQLLQLNTDTVVFKATSLGKEELPFGAILDNMQNQLLHFNSFKDKQIF